MRSSKVYMGGETHTWANVQERKQKLTQREAKVERREGLREAEGNLNTVLHSHHAKLALARSPTSTALIARTCKITGMQAHMFVEFGECHGTGSVGRAPHDRLLPLHEGQMSAGNSFHMFAGM